jgi:putative acetyltransferase
VKQLLIRPETSADHLAVFAIHTKAFGQEDESQMVERVRAAGHAHLSLVAALDEQVMGHVLFSPVSIEHNPHGYLVLGLAPIAVLPEVQQQSIGSRLIRAGLEACKDLGVAAVVLLGHPSYYPRFGFTPAAVHGLFYNGLDVGDPFMVLELIPNTLSNLSGAVGYVPEIG